MTNHEQLNNLITWLLAAWALALVIVAVMFGWAVIKHVRSVINAEPVAWLSADALPSSYPDPVCEMCGQIQDGREHSCEGQAHASTSLNWENENGGIRFLCN